MSFSAAKAINVFDCTLWDVGAFALGTAATLGAVGCFTYLYSTDSTMPTFEEREARKQVLRDYVENIHIDYGIYQTRKRIYTDRAAVERRRQELIADIEHIYDAAVTEGTILYRCNAGDVFVAVPKSYLQQRYGITIDAETYIFEYARDLLPERVTVGRQSGIPGIDPRGYPIREPWVWDDAFGRSFIDPENVNLFLSSRCAELLKLITTEAEQVTVTNVTYRRIGRLQEAYDYIMFRPELH